MKIPIFQVDAFTNRIFGGNPAAVCPLDAWLPGPTLQAIAMENNLAETAFFTRPAGRFEIRWFTPAVEVSLCGHATLAAAHVIFHHLGYAGAEIAFESKSGILKASRRDGLLMLDFPAYDPVPMATPEDLIRGLGRTPLETLRGRDIMAVFGREADVAGLEPDFAALARLDCLGVIATAKGDTADFVSRFFAPRAGIPEDPVTGSAHTLLIPYWAEKFHKTRLRAVQISKRRGELHCELRGDRVLMGGRAVTFLEGAIEI